jgi:hypothetical protein
MKKDSLTANKKQMEKIDKIMKLQKMDAYKTKE